MIDLSQLDSITKENIMKIAYNYNDVIIMDLSYHMYRFFYAFKQLSINHNGFVLPTGHMYGVLRQVCTLKRELDNPAIIIVVDGYDKERAELDSNYKAGRSEKSYNIHNDTDKLLSMLGLMPGVFVSHHPHYEADDTIHSVAITLDKLFMKNNLARPIYLFTSDKDLYQSIDNNIRVLKSLGKNKGNIMEDAVVVDIEGLFNEFNGVLPGKVAEYRALLGDTSDNLKGYSRFPKAIAAMLANQAEFRDSCVVLEDCSDKTQKWIDVVNSDFGVFQKNYKMMKLKEYPFSLYTPDHSGGYDLVNLYQMNVYSRELEYFRSRGK